jgi:hypothetical protein
MNFLPDLGVSGFLDTYTSLLTILKHALAP